jgi:hypothetical protein
VFRAGERRGIRMPAPDREPAEQGEHERPGDGPGPPRDGDGRATDSQVGLERVEFAVRSRCEQDFKPLLKLVGGEPPLSGRAPQPLGHLLPIGI